MTKREIVKKTLAFDSPPYVPWAVGFTAEAAEKLYSHYGKDADLDIVLDNHFVDTGPNHPLEDIGNDCYRDVFGVVWDRSVDKDIGVTKGCVLPEPTLKNYSFPNPTSLQFFQDIPVRIAHYDDCYRRFCLGFSLYEKAWTMRGMENLLMDMIAHPAFVHELFDAITEYNIAQIKEALKYDIDCVYFGDDWGQQNGLIMGIKLWREFIKPYITRMYKVVADAGKAVSIHSCGDVDELFDDLVEVGVNLFNPFQPEVMDVHALLQKYHGKLAFHGGLSMQRTLPYGTPEDVREETRQLLVEGACGGYVFSPSHAVEGDVPLENMLAFIDELHTQPGYAPPES